jgi:hypothetical protein
MERSVIRDSPITPAMRQKNQQQAASLIPDYASLHPGYAPRLVSYAASPRASAAALRSAAMFAR